MNKVVDISGTTHWINPIHVVDIEREPSGDYLTIYFVSRNSVTIRAEGNPLVALEEPDLPDGVRRKL